MDYHFVGPPKKLAIVLPLESGVERLVPCPDLRSRAAALFLAIIVRCSEVRVACSTDCEALPEVARPTPSPYQDNHWDGLRHPRLLCCNGR